MYLQKKAIRRSADFKHHWIYFRETVRVRNLNIDFISIQSVQGNKINGYYPNLSELQHLYYHLTFPNLV